MGKRRKAVANKPATRKPAKKKFNSRGLLRQLLIIFLLSFFISTALIIYLFGMTDDFFGRLFWCLLVVFLMIATLVLGIIPVINYYGNKWPK
jgi:membrane protein YdbS with pleckstrin-like domain